MKKIQTYAFAKINIFLEIPGLRDDGYHSIDTVMQSVSLADDVTVEETDDGEVSLSCQGIDIPQEENLAWRAAKLYLDRAGIASGSKITLVKRIPSGAGLGGGSSDAAAVLRALNEMYGRFDADGLCKLGAMLGSDVPFCIVGGCASATGRGEVIHRIPCLLPYCRIVLAKGERSTSTAEAYRAIDKLSYRPRSNTMERIVGSGNLEFICNAMFNRFEDVPGLDWHIMKRMIEAGALTARLTGSGSAIFGIFSKKAEADEAVATLRQEGYWSVLCNPTGALL